MAEALAPTGVAADAVADFLLIVSEVVSNAVRHARTEFTVSLSLNDDALRIEVFDADTRPPALLGLDEESTSGRGLHLVAALTSDWGWRTAEGAEGSGKVVWGELALRRPEAE